MGSDVKETRGESSNSAESSKKSKRKSGAQYDCEVTCLDGTIITTSIEKSAKGEELFDKVVQELDLTAKEYVGLLFKSDNKTWLDIHKDMKHQIGDSKAEFHFRVKFYEPEPARLQDVYMRYLLYMQLQEDLREKRLVCSDNITALLGSYTAQAELGDFHFSEHDHDYLEGYYFAHNNDVVQMVNSYHKEHRGQSPAQAELNFLEIAKKIPRYGVDIHKAMDSDGPVEIGVAALGINIYRDDQRELLFRWKIIHDFLYNRRKFTVKLKEPMDENNSKKTYVYYFDSAKLCKQCYKAAVEYHTFFRLTKPDAPRKRLDSLKLRSSFRYSDRTLYQMRNQNMNEGQKEKPNFKRTPSKRRTVPNSNKPLIEPEVPYIEPTIIAPQHEEPVQFEEIEIDEANPEDDRYDPKEWETVEKTLPDGTKKRYRRRIIIVKVVKKPKEAVVEEPIQYEEVEIDESNPEDDRYDPNEWEVVEKPQEDGSTKRYRRRIIIVKIIKKPEELVNENEVIVEEMPVDESTPDDEQKYDPEWETVEKLEPDGSVKKYRRRIFIVKIIRKNQDEEPVDESDCKVEEVELDEANPEDEQFDPEEWETIDRPQVDGTTKKFRRRLYIMKVVKRPSPDNEDGVNYEEEEVNEENPDDAEKYDPEEWEDLVKTQPDGSVKRYRRRIVVVKFVKAQEYEKVPEKQVQPIEEQPIECEEIELDENSPDLDSLFDDPEFEIVTKKKPDGTIVRVKRRIMRVTVVKKFTEGSDEPIEECPVKFEEVEIDENSPEFENALNDPESEIIEKKKDDGTIIRVRRRAMKVTVRKPVRMTITSHPVHSKGEDEEDAPSYEEIEVDENSPVHFDRNIWEEYEKVQPDGSVKKFRRRYISKCNVILKKPSTKSKDVTNDVEYEEVDMENDNEPFDPQEWEIIEKEQPDGTKKRIRRRIITTTITTTYTTTRYVIHADGEEDPQMESKPIESSSTITFVDGHPVSTSETKDDMNTSGSLSPVEMSMSMDDLISEINEMSMGLDNPNSPPERKPISENETITAQAVAPVESSVELPALSSSVDEEELKRREEEERLDKEGLNATIDSIFTLPSDDEVKSPIRHGSNYDEDAYNESFDNELDEYGLDVHLTNESKDDGFEIDLPDPTIQMTRTKPKKAPKPAPRQRSHEKTTSSSDSDDGRDTTRSNAANEQDDFKRNNDGNSSIIYTVTDVSQVEQGRGGFVSAVRAKHENLAHEDPTDSPRSSRVFDSPPSTPKGHVPTRTVSFNENDKPEVVKTRNPPSVPAKPTVIVPDESELPEEEYIFRSNQSQEESYPDMEQDCIEATDIPEVETEVIFIKETSQDDVRVAPVNSEPGVVRTRPYHLPRQDTQVIKTEIIEVDLTPSHMESFHEDEAGDLSVSSEQLPTEVITKTITIEGDSTELTPEEIAQLLSQAPEEVGDIGSFTTTQVVRTTTVQKTITGKTITVSGDADDQEIQRMLNAASSGDGSQMMMTDEDGNVIITAIRDETIEVTDDDGTEI